jgi:glycosyltransferase involved in cell wall biosynthesis
VISFIIPAHNEEALIARTIQAIADAAAHVNLSFEILVVDDSSSDRTADAARAAGARVVSAQVHQIAAARNAGAAAAAGDVLVFVDANTIVPAETLRQTLAALEAGCVAGGAPARLDTGAQWWAHLSWLPFQVGARVVRLPGGAYMFMTRQAFESAGRFDERYFAGEEIQLGRALKRVGRFRVVRHPVITSGRKFRILGFRGMTREWLKLARRGPAALRDRKHLGLWYDRHRD